LEFPLDENTLPVGKALLTNIGRELVLLSGSSSSSEFYDYVIETWHAQSIILSTPVVWKD